MNESKKLGEFMIGARIPHAWRNRIPIVSSPEQIVWVVGYRINERVKIMEDTKRVLQVEFRRKSENSSWGARKREMTINLLLFTRPKKIASSIINRNRKPHLFKTEGFGRQAKLCHCSERHPA